MIFHLGNNSIHIRKHEWIPNVFNVFFNVSINFKVIAKFEKILLTIEISRDNMHPIQFLLEQIWCGYLTDFMNTLQ